MDKIAYVMLARRYAQAYLNVYGHELTPAIRERIKTLRDFLDLQSRIIFFLMIPSISGDVKERGIAFLGEKFELPQGLQKSMQLLLRSKRAFLLGSFFEFIDTLYQQKHGITSFVISSSHELELQERDFLAQFFKELVNRNSDGNQGAANKSMDGDVLCTYEIDKKLIAGIRMYSSTHLWEHSVAKQLQSVQWLTVR